MVFTCSLYLSTSLDRKMESTEASNGNTLSTSRPEVRPPILGKMPLRCAQRVGPKLAVAHANPIRIPLIVDVISGVILCPITIFAACPPFSIEPVSARNSNVGSNSPRFPEYRKSKKNGKNPTRETNSSFLGLM